MQQLNEKDFIRIKKTHTVFHKLGIRQELNLEEKFGQAVGSAFYEFVTRCKEDEEWRKCYCYMHDYQEVTKFDMDTNFEVMLGDSEYKYQVFNANIKNEYVDSYEHLENYKKHYTTKINKLNDKRFALCKKFRINHLKHKLQNIENEANLYAYWQQKDALKNDYLENRTKTYNQVRAKFNQIENDIAEAIVSEALKHKSILIYREHDSVLKTNFEVDGFTYEISSQNLNNVANRFRCEILNYQAVTPAAEPTHN